jgi:hypothetical protein
MHWIDPHITPPDPHTVYILHIYNEDSGYHNVWTGFMFLSDEGQWHNGGDTVLHYMHRPMVPTVPEGFTYNPEVFQFTGPDGMRHDVSDFWPWGEV